MAAQIYKLLSPLDAYRGRIAAVQAPGLIIDQDWPGKEPGQTPPEQLAAIMGDAAGHSIPQSGHSVHQDQPERVNALIRDFLATKVGRA